MSSRALDTKSTGSGKQGGGQPGASQRVLKSQGAPRCPRRQDQPCGRYRTARTLLLAATVALLAFAAVSQSNIGGACIRATPAEPTHNACQRSVLEA